MALSLPYPGEKCEQVGISAQGIVNRQLPVLPIFSITKGVVFELTAISCGICFYEWLKLILDDALLLTPSCVKAAVSRLSKKYSEVSRNKHGDQIILFHNREPFLLNRVYP